MRKVNNSPFMATFVGVAFFIALSGCDHAKIVDSKTTTEGEFWQNETSAKIRSCTADEAADIEIYLDKPQQQILGFGGCFNELGWEQLIKLSNDNREQILRDLFDPETGCKFNLCRMPIGANDYSVQWYSYNEQDNDLDMQYFSIDHDRQRLIPYIKAAQKYAPDLKLWASPWCPPSWMKTNHHYACSPGTVNDLQPEGAGQEMQTQFRMESEVLNAYALYFSKFVQAYTREGIPISAVHVQNEPNSCQVFPSCVWRPEDLATFIGKYLGPQFEKDSLKTDIYLGTIERPQIERVSIVLDDPQAKKYIKGVGFQWAGKDAIPEVQQRYPGLQLIQTETECGNGSNDWAAAVHTWNLICHYFNHGANAYMYWNMVLDETGKSQWGWKQNSMITIDNDGQVSYNPEFYLMKHLSSFVEPGAVKLALSGAFDQFLAFENPDKSLILVAYNSDDNQKKVKIKLEDKILQIDLKPASFTTLRLKL